MWWAAELLVCKQQLAVGGSCPRCWRHTGAVLACEGLWPWCWFQKKLCFCVPRCSSATLTHATWLASTKHFRKAAIFIWIMNHFSAALVWLDIHYILSAYYCLFCFFSYRAKCLGFRCDFDQLPLPTSNYQPTPPPTPLSIVLLPHVSPTIKHVVLSQSLFLILSTLLPLSFPVSLST